MRDISIATISLARNEEEEKILCSSLEQLARLSLPVFITDGGSSAKFRQALHRFPNFSVFEEKGLWSQSRRSIREANKTARGFICYTEPDKLDFFLNHLRPMLELPVNDATGIVLASRSAKGFASFPEFQQMTEITINQCCEEVIGKKLDYCYGPFLFNSKLVPVCTLPDEHCGWGWRPFLFVAAHRLGLEIQCYEGDFYCPPDQREDNPKERIYRMKQLIQNIHGLVKAATTEFQGPFGQ